MLTPGEIYANLDALVIDPPEGGAFGLGIMQAVGAPRSTITRLSEQAEGGAFTWTRMLRFQSVSPGQSDAALDSMWSEVEGAAKSKRPRILLAFDGKTVAARDTKLGDELRVALDDLAADGDIFFPLGGHERYVPPQERMADVRATKHISRFHDAVRDANPLWSSEKDRHALNIFMARVLFCLFSDDVGIFTQDVFETALRRSTSADGSDLSAFLDGAFKHMNTHPDHRTGATHGWSRFPYVNGGLFNESSPTPTLDGRCRKYLLDCARLNWRTINPDIFGSMLQAVVDVEKRGELGMHYTSPTNIMKVLGPILLDSLKSELERAGSNKAKLRALLDRLGKVRVFDPACGSGNFLIIAYKELRELEIEVFRRLGAEPLEVVKLDHFYGIEIDDFACQAARLGLWIAEYQMNEQMRLDIGGARDFLPLSEAGVIVCANAAEVDWVAVCPKKDDKEVVVVGNPQFKGAKHQSPAQRTDMKAVFAGRVKSWGDLDYVAIWFFKAAEYSRETNAPFAFVSTNSIVQGAAVPALWPYLLDGLEIRFAHQSFKWSNLAKHNAGVTCVIVGLSTPVERPKRLFDRDSWRDVELIGPYLAPNVNTIVEKRSKHIAPDCGCMMFGNTPLDGGNLILDRDERDSLLTDHPEAACFVYRLFGSQELMKGVERWCLWVRPDEVEAAKAIPLLAQRFEEVRLMRQNSKRPATNDLAKVPWRFMMQNEATSHTIMVPGAASEDRHWLPVDVKDSTNIVSNLAFGIFDGAIWQAAVLSSRLHRLWLETVGGRLKEDPRYSNTLVWNTFPLPPLSDRRKADLEEHWWEIDLARKEAGLGRSLGELYSPKTMPIELRQAHVALDATMETIFGSRRYRSDADRIEHMLQRYEYMVTDVVEATKKATTKRATKKEDA